MAIVSDPYNTGLRGWSYDSFGGAAVGVPQPGPSVSDVEVDDSFVATTLRTHTRLNSCYAKPSLSPYRIREALGEDRVQHNGIPGEYVRLL